MSLAFAPTEMIVCQDDGSFIEAKIIMLRSDSSISLIPDADDDEHYQVEINVGTGPIYCGRVSVDIAPLRHTSYLLVHDRRPVGIVKNNVVDARGYAGRAFMFE